MSVRLSAVLAALTPVLTVSAASHASEEPLILKGVKGSVMSVAFSPDGRMLAAAAGERLYLWELSSQELRSSPRTNTGNRSGRVAFSPDGKMVALGDWELAVLAADSGKELARLGRQEKG